MKRVALVSCILISFCGSALRLPAVTCLILDAPIGKACQMSSCANMKCCADSQKKQGAAVLAKGGATQDELIVAAASNLPVANVVALEIPRPSHDVVTTLESFATERAVLCSFLI